MNRQIVLKQRPTGLVGWEDLELIDGPIPEIGEGEALIKVMYFGLDATVRTWMAEGEGYLPAVEIGEVVRSAGVGRVIASNIDTYPIGAIVGTLTGWQDYAIVRDDMFSNPWPPDTDPLKLLLFHGGAGLAAYCGLTEVGQPKEGDTLVVSAAAGATGSFVGQIGKILGCRVVGITSTDEKCAWIVDDLGFDAAINRKTDDVNARLKELCPKGIDIYFDNVGGPLLDMALRRIAMQGRVVLCGSISMYNDESRPVGPGNYLNLINRRARMEGFISLDYTDRIAEVSGLLQTWEDEGKLKWHVDVRDGIEAAPDALNALFTGANRGKSAVRVNEDPAGS